MEKTEKTTYSLKYKGGKCHYLKHEGYTTTEIKKTDLPSDMQDFFNQEVQAEIDKLQVARSNHITKIIKRFLLIGILILAVLLCFISKH